MFSVAPPKAARTLSHWLGALLPTLLVWFRGKRARLPRPPSAPSLHSRASSTAPSKWQIRRVSWKSLKSVAFCTGSRFVTSFASSALWRFCGLAAAQFVLCPHGLWLFSVSPWAFVAASAGQPRASALAAGGGRRSTCIDLHAQGSAAAQRATWWRLEKMVARSAEKPRPWKAMEGASQST